MRGRPPKPTRAHIADGDPSKRGLNRLRAKLLTEPAPALGTPATPPDLGPDGLAFWRGVCEELDRENRLALVDQFSLGMAARNFDLAARAYRQLLQQGMTIETERGIRKNPAFELFNRSAALLRQYLEQHGLTESSRARLNVEASNKLPPDLELEMVLSGGDPAHMRPRFQQMIGYAPLDTESTEG